MYLLNIDDSEIARLDSQYTHLDDPILLRLLAEAKSVLDIGCGSGYLANLIHEQKLDLQYLGIDQSEKVVEHCRAHRTFGKNNIRYAVADISDSQAIQGQYDLVVCRLVLWALGDNLSQQLISRLKNHLNPNGVVYFFEPDDRLLTLTPRNIEWQDALLEWQGKAKQNNSNPFIGSSIYGWLVKSDYKNIRVVPRFKSVTSETQPQFNQSLSNLMKIFSIEPQRLDHFSGPGTLLTEGYFTTIASGGA